MKNINPIYLIETKKYLTTEIYNFINEGRILTKFLQNNCSPSDIASISSKLSKSAGKDQVWRKDLANALKKNRKRIRDGVHVKHRGRLDMAAALMDIDLV